MLYRADKYQDPGERRKLWLSLTSYEREAALLIMREQAKQRERDYYSLRKKNGKKKT